MIGLHLLQILDAPVVEPLVDLAAIQVKETGHLIDLLGAPVCIETERSCERFSLIGSNSLLLCATDATFSAFLRAISFASVLVFWRCTQ